MSTTNSLHTSAKHRIGFDFIWSEKHPIGFYIIWIVKHPIGFDFIWSVKHPIGFYVIWSAKHPNWILISFEVRNIQLDFTSFEVLNTQLHLTSFNVGTLMHITEMTCLILPSYLKYTKMHKNVNNHHILINKYTQLSITGNWNLIATWHLKGEDLVWADADHPTPTFFYKNQEYYSILSSNGSQKCRRILFF